MENSADAALVALRQILKATDDNVRQLATQSGLTASQLLVLQVLKTRGEILTGQLAHEVDLKQATISVMLDKMQTLGLIERRRSESDRRRVWVSITPAGQKAIESAPDLLQDRFQKQFDALPDWERAYLVSALLRVVALLDAENIDASPVLDLGALHELPHREKNGTAS